MRKPYFLVCAALVAFAWACDSGSPSNDGGADATSEPFDICSTFTTAGDTCTKASNIVCFRDDTCDASNGCSCKESDGGSPTWQCYTPPECLHPCSSSPYADAECPDANDGGTTDEAGDDGGDAAADAAAE